MSGLQCEVRVIRLFRSGQLYFSGERKVASRTAKMCRLPFRIHARSIAESGGCDV